jgi:hypothetical protein
MTTDSNITRRQAMKTAGLAGAACLIARSLIAAISEGTAIAAGGCANLTPELTEGPYWVNTMLRRSNLLPNAHGGGEQVGVPLDLYITLPIAHMRGGPNTRASVTRGAFACGRALTAPAFEAYVLGERRIELR